MNTSILTAVSVFPPRLNLEPSTGQLNPNRLNVAMSRMKKKLVIVASQSVFEVTPPDADEFDQTLIWKRLYDALGVTADSPATAVWNGQLNEFCPAEIDIPTAKATTNIEIYSLSATEE